MNFSNNQNNNSILVIRFSSMGDIILTTALVRTLRKKFPQSIIDIVTSNKYSEVFINNPYITNLIEYDKKWNLKQIRNCKKQLLRNLDSNKYDIVIDLQNNLRSLIFRFNLAKHHLKVKKERIKKILLIKFKINLYKKIRFIPEKYLAAALPLGIVEDDLGCEIWLSGETGKNQYPPELKNPLTSDNLVIGIAAGAHHATKRWPLEKFAELCNILYSAFGADIILLGGTDDKEICDKIVSLSTAPIQNCSGSKSILATAEILDRCSLLVSNDTGVMHIAAARKVPVVAIFGSTVPEFGFSPYRVENIIVQKELSCRPCTNIGRDKCPLGHFNCMNQIEVEDVMDAIKKLSRLKGN